MDKELNCRGMRCPLPVIYARRALASMAAGQVLMLVATDPGSVTDITEFSKLSDVELVEHREENGDYIFFLRRPRDREE
jgi:tRNA 2-thiouridine synthesizing protein A